MMLSRFASKTLYMILWASSRFSVDRFRWYLTNHLSCGAAYGAPSSSTTCWYTNTSIFLNVVLQMCWYFKHHFENYCTNLPHVVLLMVLLLQPACQFSHGSEFSITTSVIYHMVLHMVLPLQGLHLYWLGIMTGASTTTSSCISILCISTHWCQYESYSITHGLNMQPTLYPP